MIEMSQEQLIRIKNIFENLSIIIMKPRVSKEYVVFTSQFNAENIDEIAIKTDKT
jgi:hypothetical protein